MRRLIFPCVLDSRACCAGHIRFGDVEFRWAKLLDFHQASRTLCQVLLGDLSIMVLAGCAWSSDPLSSHFRLVVGCFQRPLVTFVLPTFLRPIKLRDRSGVSHETRSSGMCYCSLSSSTSIPIRRGSQSVSCFNILQATTAILRAKAIAAFFLRVFWPP